ncbi:MAG: cysteine desulfurase [Ruminococcaceae bacterium]|nr:cysteine desulfurase [Oscillospiraceae bacterium]
MIYLDNSATTRPFDSVIEKISETEKNCFGNPSSLHHLGVLAEHELTAARKEALETIGARDGNFVFTAGGTEANNMAILGTMLSRVKRRPQIITSKIEHPSVLEPIQYLKEQGADCHFVGVDSQGKIDEEEFRQILCEETALVSFMTVNNEIGALQDIPKLARLAKSVSPRVLFHTDAVQALGKVPIKVKESGVDLLSVSAHKINGPKGVGGLYIRQGVHVKPILYGGGQEGGLRSGTQNLPAIAGFGVALKETREHLSATAEHMYALKKQLIEGLSGVSSCRVIEPSAAAPHVVCALFPGIKSETLLHALEAREIYVSSGSACSSNKPQLSPTLLALGCDRKEIDGAIRFSLGVFNDEEEIRQTISVVKELTSILAI